eukprot:2334144-Prymnesium_polylepis.1
MREQSAARRRRHPAARGAARLCSTVLWVWRGVWHAREGEASASAEGEGVRVRVTSARWWRSGGYRSSPNM